MGAIRDCGVCFSAGQRQFIRIAVTLVAPRTFADWVTFTLTLREDPLWNQRSSRQLETADPHGEAWTIRQTLVGTELDAATLLFDTTPGLPIEAGENRYAFDVVATGGAAGRVELYPTTWLTLAPTTL